MEIFIMMIFGLILSIFVGFLPAFIAVMAGLVIMGMMSNSCNCK